MERKIVDWAYELAKSISDISERTIRINTLKIIAIYKKYRNRYNYTIAKNKTEIEVKSCSI